MKKSEFPDVFEKAREEKGFGKIDDLEEPVMMLLRLKDVHNTAKNWETFQSGAKPGRIVVPTEENIRETRQIPFEVDPPLHGKYRALMEAWFKRPNDAVYKEKLSKMINDLLDEVLFMDRIEVIKDFSLKLQSRALTLLLNIPYEEAETWISWGTHVFRSDDSPVDAGKAAILYNYIDTQIEKAIKSPGDDLYSLLLASEIDGRKLSKEEVKGVLILTFAGGRDTVINAITNVIAYFAEHPKSLTRLREEPRLTPLAVEELVRYFSPLTHMGRVVTKDTEVCEHAIKANEKVSLCWAAANRDANNFKQPNKVILDRKMNPHVGFGFGVHKCLGATHARQLLKILINTLSKKVQAIEIIDYEENIEDWQKFKRKVGFNSLTVKFKNV